MDCAAPDFSVPACFRDRTSSFWFRCASFVRALFWVFACFAVFSTAANAQILSPEELAAKVEPPYVLGDKLSDKGIWSIRDLQGKDGGYIFETGPMAPLPGFSGAPIHVLVTLDSAGRFLRAELLDHNEPIFVSGLGQAPFHAFMRQYRGLSIFDTITVGVPYGAADDASSGVNSPN